MQSRQRSPTLLNAMTIRNRILLVAAILALAVGANAFGQGAGGHHGPGGRGNAPPPGGGFGGQSRPGREFVPPDSFVRPPRPDGRQPDRRPPGESPRDPGRPPGMDERVVDLNNAVSMVQERFNATAVKTDTVMEAGQLVYRIRLLSADRSRVWTVSVDARTGRIN